MTCDEYLAILAATPADEIRRARLPDHAATCPHCQRATRLVMERERSYAGLDDDIYSQVPAAVPPAALVAQRRRLVNRLYRVGIGILIVGSLGLYVGRRMVPTPTGAATSERAFLVQCLTAEEAGAIARPLLGPSGQMIYAGEPGRGVVTVRGTPEQIRDVTAALEQAAQRGLQTCRVPSLAPPATP